MQRHKETYYTCMPQLLVLFLVKHITADDFPQTDYQYSRVEGLGVRGGPVIANRLTNESNYVLNKHIIKICVSFSEL